MSVKNEYPKIGIPQAEPGTIRRNILISGTFLFGFKSEIIIYFT